MHYRMHVLDAPGVVSETKRMP